MSFIVTLYAKVALQMVNSLSYLLWGLLVTLCYYTCSFLFVSLFRKAWLSKVGSPSSRIDRTDFSNEKTISKLEYSNFSIRY